MAAPSEPITWSRLGLGPNRRVCAVCGKKPLKLDDLCQYIVRVGRMGSEGFYRSEGVQLACKDCGPVLS